MDSNLHREHILPSEKAFAYRMKLEAMSRQGHRSDLTSDQLGRKLETAEIIAQQSDDSKSQVRRYIRLTYLIPELLEKMDQGEIALSVGVELSFLDEQNQRAVLEQSQARQNRRTCMPPTEPQTIPFGTILQGKVSRNLNAAAPQESVSKQGSLSSPCRNSTPNLTPTRC